MGNFKKTYLRYNMVPHMYELTFEKRSEIVEVADDSTIETVKFSFVGLRSLVSRNLPCNVGLCGIVTSVEPHMSFRSKDGKA